jgi:hypothetical protein
MSDLSSRRRVGLAAIGTLLLALAAPSAMGSSGALERPSNVAVSPKLASSAREASAAADPEVVSLMADRKITLTEAQRRLNWQRQAPALEADLRDRLGETFGGVWIDPTSGRVKVGVVGSEDGLRGRVGGATSQLGLAEAADVVRVRHPISQLEAADSWLGNRLAQVNAGAPGPLGVALRTDLNAVELQLPSDAALTAAERGLVDETRSRYGDALRLVSDSSRAEATDCKPSSENWSFCDPPLRAGIGILYIHPADPLSLCTGAFLARSRTDGKLYQFTAGHCVAYGSTGSWSTRFADGSTHVIGSVHNSLWGSGGDMAILNVDNPAGWVAGHDGWVYVTAGPDTTRDMTYDIAAEKLSVIGQRICMSGAVSGTTCGTVLALGQTETFAYPDIFHSVTVKNLGEANFCTQKGDSGGPVFASHTAYGLVSLNAIEDPLRPFEKCISYYQGIRGAADAMNVDLVHS